MREDKDCDLIPHKCKVCGKTFNRDKDLNRHEKFCKECTCSHCKKMFGNLLLLEKHQKIHTGGNKCDTCSKVFVSKQSLKRHQASVHSEEKGFTCQQCDKKYATFGNLKRHLKCHQ